MGDALQTNQNGFHTLFRELHMLKFTELNLARSLTLINGGSIPYYQGTVSQPPSEIITGVWFKGVPDIYDKQDGTHFPNHIYRKI